MADSKKLAKDIASNLYKTKSFYVHGDIKKKIDQEVNVFTDLRVTFKGIEDYSKGRLLDLSDEVLKLVEYRDITETDYSSNLMKGFYINGELFQNRKDAKEIFVFDKDERVLSDTDPMVFIGRMSKAKRAEVMANLRLAELTFNAYNPDPIIPVIKGLLTVPVYHLNQYKPPTWQTTYPDPIDGVEIDSLPKIFEKYINFIFPIPEERSMYWAWVGNALTSRHQSFLHLRGTRGNGKTILAKITGAIIGYCYTAKGGIFSDGFNADFKNKRVIIADDNEEIGARKYATARKGLTNSMFTYNEKYKQTTQTEKNTASWIICSNPEDIFYVSCDERKMVQLTLNDKGINTVFSDKELAFFDGILKTDDSEYTEIELKFLARLGHYALNISKKELFSATHNYLGGCFWNDVIYSLGGFKRYIVETIISAKSDSYTFDELYYGFEDSKTAGQSLAKFETIKRFLLTEFIYKGECIVSSISKDESIVPIQKYRASTEVFKEEEFDL